MVWAFASISLVAAVLAVIVYLSTRGWPAPLRLAAVVFVVLFVPVVGGLLWKEALVAIAITSVTVLAVAAMFQKVPAGKAVQGALIGLFLIFAFSWLALILADVFLFEKTDVSFVPLAFRAQLALPELDQEFTPGLLCAVGVALIVGAGLLPYKACPALSLPGLVITLWLGPRFLETVSYSNPDLAMLRNPFLQGTLLIAAVLLTAQWVSASRSRNGQP